MEDQDKTKDQLINELNEIRHRVLELEAAEAEALGAEKTYRESEERWKFALEGARDGVWDWNAQTNEVFFSRQWKSMLGFEEHEIGTSLDEWDKRVHPEDKQQCHQDLNRHFSGETRFYENEHRVLCKDGTYKWILDRGKVMEWTDDGKPLRVIGTHTDVTERKRTEEDLRISEEKFSKAFFLSPDAILVTRLVDGMIVSVNEGFKQLSGYDEEEFVGKTILEMDIWENPEDRNRWVEQLKADGRVTNFEARLRGKDRRLRYGVMSASIIVLNGVEHILNVVRDIADSKCMQEAIRESEARFKFLTEAMVDIVWTMDLDLLTTYVSPSMERILGYSQKERTLKTIDDIVTPESVMNMRQVLADELQKEREGTADPDRNVTLVAEYLKSDGSTVWLENKVSGIRDSQGTLIGIHGLSRDITERIHSERKLSEQFSMIASILENAAEGICVFHSVDDYPFVRFTHWNRTMGDLTGYGMDEINRLGYYQTMYPDPKIKSLVIERMARMRVGENLRNEEWAITNRAGEERTVSISTSVLKDVKGEVHVLAVMRDRTDAVQAERALRESEEKYRLIFSKEKDAIVLTDFESLEFVDVNEAAVALYGYSKEEFLSMTAMAVSVEPEKSQASLKAGAEPEGVQVVERWHRKKDGTVFPVEISAGPLEWNGRKIVCSIIRDITERKRAEEALRESEENFRSFFNAVDDIIIVGNQDGTIVHTNPAVSSKLGYRPDELQTMNILELHPRELREEAERIFGAMFRGEREVCPLPLQSKSGVLVPVETRVWFGKWSGVDCIFGMCKDLTKEQEALQKFNRFFHSNPCPMAVSTISGTEFVDVNDAFLSTLDFSRDEVIGNTSDQLNLFVDPQAQEEIAQKLENDGMIRNIELKVRKKDGTIVAGLFSGEAIESQGQKYFLTVMLDISERKRAEEALRESEEKYRLIFSKEKDAIILIDSESLQILDVNEAAVNLYGYSREEFMSKTALVVSAEPDQSKASLKVGSEPEGVRVPERWHRKNDGTSFPVEISAGPVTWNGRTVVCCIIRDISERRQAQEELRRSQERLELAMKGANLGSYDLDITNGQGAIDERVHEIIGYSPGEFTYNLEMWREFVHPEDIEKTLEDIQDHMTGRTDRVDHEYRVRKKSGEYAWVLSRGRVVERDTDGRPLRMSGTVMDITDRKLVDEKLRESEERLQLAMQGANLGMWDLDFRTGRSIISKRTAEIAGYAWEDVEPTLQFWISVIHPDDKFRVLEIHRRILQGLEDSVRNEYRIQTKSGEHVWVLNQARVFEKDSDGRPLRMAGTFMDITERKKAEQASRQSEERYKILFEKATDAIAIYGLEAGKEGRVLAANKAFADMHGYEPEELLALGLQDLDTPESVEMMPTRVERVRRGEWLQDEVTHRRKDGSHFPLEISVGLIEFGNETCAVSIERDISDRKQAELEKEELRSQLLQSQKMEAVGTLAAGIAHDFNNMLQVILGYSDMLLNEKTRGEPGHQELEKIVKTSIEARDLVRKIRLFSRKADIEPVAVDLNHQVTELTKLLSHTLLKTIAIDVRLGENLGTIKADPALVDQMVTNLAINASEAMPGGGSLTIRTQNINLDDEFCKTHVGTKPGPHVQLTISDTGRGMSKELLDRIFDPFFSTKQRDYHRGTGLGLSIVKGIVDEHSGYITVDSEVGRGTTFRIYFPILAVQEKAQVQGETQKELATVVGETILLVEDEELVRDLGIRLLERFGYNVIAVGDGQEAVEVYARERDNIAMVILDIVMPRMNGKECLQELFKINPQVKVLISSGVAQEDRVKEVVDLGARGALLKPYSMKILKEKVREVLDAVG